MSKDTPTCQVNVANNLPRMRENNGGGVTPILSQEKIKEENKNWYDSVIVNNENEIIEYSNEGYVCDKIGKRKWLMRKKV